MNTPDPVIPKDFGIRYMLCYTLWICWTNKLSLLFILQGAILELTVDYDVPKPMVHHILFAYNIVGLILAQVSRAQGHIPPPTKELKPHEQ